MIIYITLIQYHSQLRACSYRFMGSVYNWDAHCNSVSGTVVLKDVTEFESMWSNLETAGSFSLKRNLDARSIHGKLIMKNCKDAFLFL